MRNGRVQFGPMSVLRSSMDRRVIGERSDAVLRTAMPGDDELIRSRGKCERMRNNERHERNDRHERVASKQEGRRSAEKRTNQEPHRTRMRRAPSLLSSHRGRTEAQDFIKTS